MIDTIGFYLMIFVKGFAIGSVIAGAIATSAFALLWFADERRENDKSGKDRK